MGDEAFPIRENLLKPYPRDQSGQNRTKAIFNYRLSRARRIVENAFGLLTQHFRIFLTPIHLNVNVLEDLVTVACILHNLMIDDKGIPSDRDMPVSDLDSLVDNFEIESDSNQELKYKIRDTFKDYFNGVGAVHWQDDSFRL